MTKSSRVLWGRIASIGTSQMPGRKPWWLAGSLGLAMLALAGCNGTSSDSASASSFRGAEISDPTATSSAGGPISANGEPEQVRLVRSGDSSEYVFTGLAGQSITVATRGGSFADNCGVKLKLIDADGYVLGDAVCAGQSGSLPATVLRKDGSYKLVLKSSSASDGRLMMALTASAGPTSITPGARALGAAHAPAAGEAIRYGFVGTQGSRIAARTAKPSGRAASDSCVYTLRLYAPDGSALTEATCADAGATLPAMAAKSDGVYQLEIRNAGTGADRAPLPKLQVFQSQDAVASMAIAANAKDGMTASAAIAQPGQRSLMHFSGRQGERFRLLASESKIATEAGPPSDLPRFDCDETKLSVLRPDGSVLASNRYCGANGYIKPFDLDASGDWTVVTESTNGGTGSAKLALMPVSSSVATTSTVLGTIPTNGSAVTATISTPGDSADFTFNGIAGRRFSLVVNNPNFPDSNDYIAAYLLRPDGSIRASVTCYNYLECLIDPVDGTTSSATALETSGTWTVSLHALYENSAGSAQLRLYTVTDQTGSIASNGTAVTSTITVPGQRSIFTFAGTAGQRFSTLTTPATGFPNSYYVYFRRPDGSLYYVTNGSDTTAIQGESTLDQTGEWALVFDPQARDTGNTSIQLYRPVDQTGSIPSNGTAQTVTIGTPGQNAALSFTGTAGQRLSIALSDVALGDCSAYSTASIRLQRPDGSEFSTQVSYYCSGGFLEFGTLDQSGTWTIILDPQGAITGSATLRLYAATDTTATIATNGTAQTATFTTPGQASRFTFSATGGQRYSVRVSGASLTPDTSGYVSFDRPDGSSVTGIGFSNGSEGFIDAFEIDQTGTWTVRIDPYSDGIGTVTVQVYAITDQTGTIATNGTARAVNITAPGQNARLTFTGSVGQRLSLRSSDNVFGAAQSNYGFMRLRRPDGSALNDTAFYTSGGFAEPAVLDQAGTWTVEVDPIGRDTLTGNVQLYLISDQTGTIATNGTALAVNLATPGQRALLSFSGTAGQRYSLRLTDAAFSIYDYSYVSLVRPDGTALVNTPLYGASGFIEPFALDQTGTWTVRIDPLVDSTGIANARLNLITDQTGAIAINGAAVTSTTTVPGQRSRLTFTGAVGASMTVTARDAVFSGSSSGALNLIRPDGSTMVGSSYGHTGVGPGTVSGQLGSAILDQAGTWAILLDPYGDQTATASVQLVRNSTGNSPTTTPEPAPISAIATNGTPVSINLASPTPQFSYSFTGTAGQRYSIRLTDSTLNSGAVLVYLRRPDGVLVYGGFLYNPDDSSEAYQLDQTGSWRVVVETYGGTGTASLRLYAISDQTGTIATNGTASTSTITVPGQNSAFTFTGTAGERYSVRVNNATFDNGNTYGGDFYLRAPDGTRYGGNSLYSTQSSFSEPLVLNQSGIWTVVVDPFLRGTGAGTGTATVQLYRVTDQAAAINSNGTAVNANLTVPGQRTAFTFSGTAGQRYSVQISSPNLSGVYGSSPIYLRRPDGALVNGGTIYDSSGTQIVGPYVLEQSGAWTVVLDPYAETTGTATVRLYLTADQTGTAPTNGTTFNASITTPGQQSVFSFDGVTGERYSLDVSNLNFTDSGYVQIFYRRPGDGGRVYSGIAYNPGGFIEPIQLDRSGTWQIIVTPYGSSTGTQSVTGTATLKLYRVNDTTAALANDGTAMSSSLTVPGQRALFTFNGTVGERYSLRFSNANFVDETYSYEPVLIRRPDGVTTLYNYVYNDQPTFIDAESLVLNQSGTWTVIVDPYGRSLGSVTAQLYRANDQTGSLLPDGSPLASTITVPGQRSRFSFNATAGQVYDLTVQESSFNSPDYEDVSGCQASFSLLRPDNSPYQSIQGNTCLPGTAFRNVPLDTAGIWTVLVNPNGPVLGTANVRLTLKGSPVPTYWADLTSAVVGTPGTAAGSIGAPIPVGFSYAGEVGSDTRIDNSFPSWLPAATFAGGTVADAPTIRDSLQLSGGEGTAVNTITFARAVRNPVLAVAGVGSGNVQNLGSFVFSGQPFTIQAGGVSNDYGGTSILATGDTVVGNNGNGTVQFNGTYSAISWTTPISDEYRVIVGIPLQPPPAPTGVTAAAASTQVTLNWAAAQTAATYNVYRSTTASDPSPVLVASDITGLSTVITGLTNDTTYYFRVAGVNAGGTGARSAEVSAIPGPTIRINDVNVTEGNSGTTTASFTVSLSRAATSTVTVAYATANGTATSGSDYVAASGSLSFTAGQTSRTVAVTINGDLTVEPNETVRVNLTTPTNATIADSQGVATIVNDDLPTASINDVTVTEGNSGTANATFTVSLSAAAVAPVTVAYATADGTATAGSDYAATSGTASFAVGQSTQTITVPINGDLLVEASETFVVNLSAPTAATIADGQGIGTIGNDDATALSIGDASVTEGNAGTVTASFTVSLSAASALPVTVAYATADGTATAGSDYVAASGTLSFAAGQTTQTVAVVVNGDTSVEGNESFVVNLSTPTGATIADGLGLGTIGNDDAVAVTLSINDVSLSEGNAGTVNATFTVSLSAASATPVTVAWATADGTATAGSDYTAASGTLNFAAGQTTQTISVAVIGDTLVEPNEGFVVNLSAASGATIADAQGAGTIVNDDVAAGLPSVTINDVSTTEGNTGTRTVVVTLTLSAAATSDVSVRFATAPGTATTATDYVNSSGLLTFTPGQTVRTRSFTINGDTVAEPNETFFVNLTTPTGLTIADAQAVVTIIDDDAAPTPTLSIGDVTVTEGNVGTTAATFTVSLSSAATAPVTAAWATADGTAAAGSDYAATSGTVSFAAGQSSQTVTVLVTGDTVVEPDEGFVVNLTAPSGATLADAQGAATIVNDDAGVTLPSVSIADVSVTEGNAGTRTVTVTLTLSAAQSSDVSVRFATAPGTATATTDYVSSSGLLSFTAGQTTRSRNFTVNGDTAVEPNETFFVNLSTPTGLTIADSQAVVTIVDDDGAVTPTVSIGDVSLSEGNAGTVSATFTVSLSSAAVTPVTVAFATADGTAIAGSDYVAASGTVSFAAGQASQTVTVAVNGDTVVEPDEGFVVNLSAPSGATIADGQGAATIVNDDAGSTLPSVTIGDVSVTEGNAGTKTVTVTLTLSAAQATDVSVRFATAPGTATVTTDYVNSSGLLTFTAGQTSRTRNFTINGDTTIEPNETFFVNLSTPTGLTIADPQAVVTIVNDD